MAPRWKVIFAFTGIFVAGAVAGSMVALRVGTAAIETKAAAQASNRVTVTAVTTDQWAISQMNTLTKSLALTSDQIEKIRPIINSAGDNLRDLREQSSTTIDVMYDNIAAEVTAPQKEKIAVIQKEQHARRERTFNPPPGGPNGRRGGPGGPGGPQNGGFNPSRRGGPPPGDRPPGKGGGWSGDMEHGAAPTPAPATAPVVP